jgi:hypothetical protein
MTGTGIRTENRRTMRVPSNPKDSLALTAATVRAHRASPIGGRLGFASLIPLPLRSLGNLRFPLPCVQTALRNADTTELPDRSRMVRGD